MKLHNILLLICVAVLTSACAKMTTVRRSPDYVSALSGKQVVILPPKVEVNMVEFGGKKKRMDNFEYYLEGIIADNVSEVFRENHIQSKFLSNREIYDKKLVETDGRIQARANEMLADLYVTQAMDEKLAYVVEKNIDPCVTAELGKKSDSEVIAILQYTQNSKTTGAKTAEFMMAVLSSAGSGRSSEVDAAERSVMLIAFIEAKSGRLLWSNLAFDEKSMFGAMSISKDHRAKDTKEIRKLTTLALKPLVEKQED